MSTLTNLRAFLALIALAVIAPARADDGKRLFARWEADGYSYPVSVEKRKDGEAFVKYTDGVTEWAPNWRVSFLDLKVGDTVHGNWKQGGLYYTGKVARRNGDNIRINYDDGDVEDTTIAHIRLKLVHPGANKVGCRVLGRWAADGYWYVGTVKDIKDGKYHIHYDDGDKAWSDGNEVYPYTPTYGDRIQGNWLNKGPFYDGKITERKGDNIRIHYDDGDVENTTLVRVRVNPKGIQWRIAE